MSKQFTEAELLKHAKDIFRQNPDVGFLYVCDDGNFFADRDKNVATNFARESKQVLKEIVLVGNIPRLKGAVEQEDPQTRDVTALMLALDITEDRARELIKEHKGNTASAVQTERQAAPAEGAPAEAKPSTKKPKDDVTA